MMQLMENVNEAMLKACYFLEQKAPELAITQSELAAKLPFGDNYPCLMDFYVTHFTNLGNRILPAFSYHRCSKQTAKCLVYHKTNKMTGKFVRWHFIKASTTLENFQKDNRRIHGQYQIIESEGFQTTLHNCLKNKEPFLTHTILMKCREGNLYERQAIVSLEDAKSVVYYKKNVAEINKLNVVDELMNLAKANNAKGESFWSKELIAAVKKKVEDEIQV